MPGLLSSLLLLSAVLAAAPSDAAQPADFRGTYVFLSEQGEGIAGAIDAGVADLNFVIRPIARARLRKTNYAYGRLELAVEGDTLSIRMDDRQPIRLPVSGAAVPWRREDGEMFQVSAQCAGDALRQEYVAEDGQRVNAYSLSDDRTQLQLEVTVTSPKLKRPVTYRLTYQRADGQ